MDIIDVTAKELIEDHPELLRDYVAWKDNPITRMVLNTVTNEAKPQHVPISSMVLARPGVIGEISTALHAQQCGATWALERMMNLDMVPSDNRELEADYGMAEILKRDGYRLRPEERELLPPEFEREEI